MNLITNVLELSGLLGGGLPESGGENRSHAKPQRRKERHLKVFPRGALQILLSLLVSLCLERSGREKRFVVMNFTTIMLELRGLLGGGLPESGGENHSHAKPQSRKGAKKGIYRVFPERSFTDFIVSLGGFAP